MFEATETHSMTDFLTNHESHVARLKATRTPEVLTVDGRAEVVMLDTESYEDLLARLNHMEAVAAVRAIVRKAESEGPREEVTEAEIERSQAVIKELMAETERLGLYK